MLQEILTNKLIEIYFQPIVSIRTKRLYAFEALTRCKYDISPIQLFELAREQNLSFELDILTRTKSIENFYSYYLDNNELILFLNIESSLINNFDVNQDYCCIDTINKLNIPYKNFMIEIKEDEIQNTLALEEFCLYYKNLGFRIALDDFGTGNSTFDRINIIKPHLIKIDKSLFKDIENNLINKEIVKAISTMSYNLGIRVLAEGVEDESAICNAMESNISLFQGYYFSKPINSLDTLEINHLLFKILDIGNIFKEKIIKTRNEKRNLINYYLEISNKIIDQLSDIDKTRNIMYRMLNIHNDMEAIYLIDGKTSQQINDTIINKKNCLFKPLKNGDEHYLKEYFNITFESKKRIYLSNNYISYVSGNLCKTFAKRFKLNGKFYILRLDFIIKA
jgi:EAL domain-containing protein (putative c-di-GMP-specific phosphodiesterase class I)